MTRHRARVRLIVALVALFVAMSAIASDLAPAPDDEWRRFETPHVAIVTDLDETRASRIAFDASVLVATLEEIVGPYESNREPCSTIILFRDHAQFASYRRAVVGSDVPSGGFTMPSAETTYLIPLLPRRAVDARSVYRDILHDYVAAHLPAAPRWLRTGLEETIGTLHQTGRVVSTAYPRREHLRWLARNLSVAVGEVIDGSMGKARGGEAYEAESWVVTQLLVFEDLKGRERLRRYLALLAANRDDPDAFTEAFGRDPATVAMEFRGWFSRRKITPWEKDIDDLDVPRPAVVSLSRAETLVALGDVLFDSGRANLDSAIDLYRQAIGAEPDGALGHARLGIALARAGRTRDAIPHLEIAANAGVDDPLPYLALGDALVDTTPDLVVQFGPTSSSPPDAVRRARAAYERSVEIDPDRAAAWSGLARTWVFTIGDLSRGIDAASRALALDPKLADAALSLVLLHLRRNDLDRAGAALDERLRPLGADQLTRTGERAIIAWKLQRADALARTGRLSEARKLVAEVMAKADDAELRERLAIDLDAIERVEETIRLNGIYNDAIRATNDLDYATALRLVDQVLAETRDPALRHDAENLHKKIRSYMKR